MEVTIKRLERVTNTGSVVVAPEGARGAAEASLRAAARAFCLKRGSSYRLHAWAKPVDDMPYGCWSFSQGAELGYDRWQAEVTA